MAQARQREPPRVMAQLDSARGFILLLNGKSHSMVPRLYNGYQTITWVHGGRANHMYASDTPRNILFTRPGQI